MKVNLESVGTHTTYEAMSCYTYLNTYFIYNQDLVLSGFMLRMYHFIFRNVICDIFVKYTMAFVNNEELIYFSML